jgi:hypothetical protein
MFLNTDQGLINNINYRNDNNTEWEVFSGLIYKPTIKPFSVTDLHGRLLLVFEVKNNLGTREDLKKTIQIKC